MLRTYGKCNPRVGLSKYEFNNKLLGGVTFFAAGPKMLLYVSFYNAFSQLQQRVGPPLQTFKFSPKFPSVIFVFPLIRFPLPTYSLFPLTPTSHSLRTRTLSKFLRPSTPSPLSRVLQFQLLHQVTPFPQLYFLLRFFFPKICFPLSKPSLFFSLSLHSHRPSSPTSATGIFDGESCGSVRFLGLILRC